MMPRPRAEVKKQTAAGACDRVRQQHKRVWQQHKQVDRNAQAAARPARRRAVTSLEEKQMPARHHVGFYGAAFGTGFLFNAVKRNGAPAVHTLK
jgi:ferric-dicitrate binding protein FerR (iron transport regulator)